jgi:cell division transport system permease protein
LKFHQVTYLIGESFSTLRRHKAVTLLSVVIMSLTLLILAVFLLATDNVLTVLDRARRDMTVFVYLRDDVPKRVVEEHYRRLLSMEEVETVMFISKEQAMAEFRIELGEERLILGALEANPLPASFRVTLGSEYRGKDAIESFAGTIEGMPIVEEVNYGKEFIEQFATLTNAFLYVDLVLGLIVILSSIFIISNTVRLTILSRQKTIEILKLVGATNRFITTPFVIEGAFQAGLASLVSLGLLVPIYTVAKKFLPDLAFLPPEKTGLYVVTCVFLGSLGSFAALRRHLKL